MRVEYGIVHDWFRPRLLWIASMHEPIMISGSDQISLLIPPPHLAFQSLWVMNECEEIVICLPHPCPGDGDVIHCENGTSKFTEVACISRQKHKEWTWKNTTQLNMSIHILRLIWSRDLRYVLVNATSLGDSRMSSGMETDREAGCLYTLSIYDHACPHPSGNQYLKIIRNDLWNMKMKSWEFTHF